MRNDGAGPNELFDLQADPRERSNRVEDAALRSVRMKLEQRLKQWVQRYQ